MPSCPSAAASTPDQEIVAAPYEIPPGTSGEPAHRLPNRGRAASDPGRQARNQPIQGVVGRRNVPSTGAGRGRRNAFSGPSWPFTRTVDNPVFRFPSQGRVVDPNGPDPGRSPVQIGNVRAVGMHFGPAFGKVPPKQGGCGSKNRRRPSCRASAAASRGGYGVLYERQLLVRTPNVNASAPMGVRPPMPPCCLM